MLSPVTPTAPLGPSTITNGRANSNTGGPSDVLYLCVSTIPSALLLVAIQDGDVIPRQGTLTRMNLYSIPGRYSLDVGNFCTLVPNACEIFKHVPQGRLEIATEVPDRIM